MMRAALLYERIAASGWTARIGCLGAFLVAILLFRVGCGASARSQLGTRTTAIIASATRVEALRMGDNEGVWGDDNKPLGGYRLGYVGPVMESRFTVRLRDLLFDARSYGAQSSACLPNPGVAFRFRQGGDSVEVLVCLKCDQLLVITRDRSGKAIHSVYGEFDSVRGDYLRLAKEAFPKDAEIQAIKE